MICAVLFPAWALTTSTKCISQVKGQAGGTVRDRSPFAVKVAWYISPCRVELHHVIGSSILEIKICLIPCTVVKQALMFQDTDATASHRASAGDAASSHSNQQQGELLLCFLLNTALWLA
jgi:hypothetical protein